MSKLIRYNLVFKISAIHNQNASFIMGLPAAIAGLALFDMLATVLIRCLFAFGAAISIAGFNLSAWANLAGPYTA